MTTFKHTKIAVLFTFGFAFAGMATAKGPVNAHGINSGAEKHAAGDLQYWDGTKWLGIAKKISAKEPGVAPTFALCAGVPTWILYSCPGTSPYEIGETGPAGGKVFYVTEGGLHGLEAAPVDQPLAPWGCEGLATPGANGMPIGKGSSNTAAAVAGCNETVTAAKIADNYTFNGYSDWYLPSNDELNAMYTNIGPAAPAPLTNVGGFAINGYWSSSEIGANHAWTLFFGNGGQSFGIKLNPLSIRAVRSF
jgi:hypothetical protein